jgi:hypothetical protein
VKLGLSLRKEHRLRLFENRVLKRISGPKGRKCQKAGEDCIMRSFTTCIPQKILPG